MAYRSTNSFARVNVSRSMADRALKLLEIDGAIEIKFDKKICIFAPFKSMAARHRTDNRITALRRAELAQMQRYVAHHGCLMEFLAARWTTRREHLWSVVPTARDGLSR